MEHSILLDIKKLLGISELDTSFDTDIVIHINSVFMILNQLGVGKGSSFHVVDINNTWNEFLEDEKNLELVKSYIYLKVRIMFDPPTSSTVLSAFNEIIREYEWRLNVEVDPGHKD